MPTDSWIVGVFCPEAGLRRVEEKGLPCLKILADRRLQPKAGAKSGLARPLGVLKNVVVGCFRLLYDPTNSWRPGYLGRQGPLLQRP